MFANSGESTHAEFLNYIASQSCFVSKKHLEGKPHTLELKQVITLLSRLGTFELHAGCAGLFGLLGSRMPVYALWPSGFWFAIIKD